MARSSTIVLRLPARPLFVLLAAVVSLALVGVGVAGGARLARPTAVATVDLAKVLEGLDQRVALLDEIQAKQVTYQAEGRKLADELQAGVARVEALMEQRNGDELDAAGIAELDTLAEDLSFQELTFNSWETRTRRVLDRERSIAMQELFRAIRAEAEQLAAAAGYDIVIVDDSGTETVVNPRAGSLQDQIAAQMRQRRVLYAVPGVDITADLINRMNNAFNAGG